MKRILLIGAMALLAVTVNAQSYRNPVIPGFHPDPSICRVGADFYIVNSSFEYFPGVPLLHSKDLIHWEKIGNVLDRQSQLNLKGATSWLGIYAPTIRYDHGTYYMITTNVGNGGNFMVTAKDPRGPWSEPIWLQQQGIDPSLYFENGKCYMVSNPGNTITLCEIDPNTGRQLTPSKGIWQGTGGRYPEGPHLYKKDGYYYLLISEGGTELAHRLTIARSRNIEGPYEANPANPILTNCSRKGQYKQIQGTGHGDFVQAKDGSWWLVFLAYRNPGGSYHHLGRETCLAPVEWKSGEWPVINGGNPIDTVMSARLLPPVPLPRPASLTTFDRPLGPEWVYIQNPIPDHYRLLDGKLRLIPHGTLTANDQPTFVGKRQGSVQLEVETKVRANHCQAGLSLYQIQDGHIDLVVSGNQVSLLCKLKSIDYVVNTVFVDGQDVKLRIRGNQERYDFEYAVNGKPYQSLGKMDCSLLSTEVAGGFTGVMVGMMAEGDPSGYADFSYYDMKEK